MPKRKDEVEFSDDSELFPDDEQEVVEQSDAEVVEIPYVEPILPQKVEEPEPDEKAPPSAKFVFDATVAALWLSKAYVRVSDRHRSVRFEPEGISPKHVSFVVFLLARAMRSGGILYVPASFANHDHLSGFDEIGTSGAYVSLKKK